VGGGRPALAAPTARNVSTYTGYGFDTCSAPSLVSLNAWLTSSFRAVGIYLGGVNRACKDGRLSSAWVSGAQALGWNLIPLYVGLQAPCVAQSDLARISAESAAAQGAAAADDAVSRAAFFGIGAGNPIYFDMEGYSTKNPSCSQTVRDFVSAWVAELHAAGYVAGVYGSAASTIRDMVPLATIPGASPPDDVWIANWNGVEAVYGDPYVSDDYWHNHQRLHQYRGGHKETHGGVTINIDSTYLDGAVVGLGNTPPPPPPPPPTTTTTTATTPTVPAGSVASSDGRATASWPDGAFPLPATVSLTPSSLPATIKGFAAGSYVLQLSAVQNDNGSTLTGFLAPLDIHVLPPTSGLVVAYSSDGSDWAPVGTLAGPALQSGASRGYLANADGSIDILTTVPGSFGLLQDVGAPGAPSGVRGHFAKGALVLQWQPAQDNSREIARYDVTRDNSTFLTTNGAASRATVRSVHGHGAIAFRVVASDAAGNASRPSRAVVVVPTPKPAGLPRPLPRWVWPMLDWQSHGKAGPRPKAAPHKLPRWYWKWADWRTRPFSIA
ncbi:MAG: glycoside hydrolase domain-containing protein, partial [Gaiellaceae bacterium]